MKSQIQFSSSQDPQGPHALQDGQANSAFLGRIRAWIPAALRWDRLWNRGLPPHARIAPTAGWPLLFLPLLLFLQLTDPSPVWTTLLVGLLGFYGLGYAWVRSLAWAVSVKRRRQGVMLVAGDTLEEEFTVRNASPVPLLWAEFRDHSFLPGYRPDVVVGCGGQSEYRWRSQALCRHRGVFRLGPHSLHTGDPFGLFRLTLEDPRFESLLVYPRVAHLPALELPRGLATGQDRRRRPLTGSLRSASVRDYLPGDSLRFVHWPSTAHRGALTVTDLELEPSGDLWIVLDLERSVHQGEGEASTLETSIVLAASLAAELLGGGQRRAVGLMAAGELAGSPDEDGSGMVLLPPQPGKAQLWQILGALAPLQPGDLPLDRLLHSGREVFGRGRTVVVITPVAIPPAAITPAADGQADGTGGESRSWAWISELVHLQGMGLASSVLLVTPAGAGEAPEDGADGRRSMAPAAALRALLAQQGIPARLLQAGTPLQPALTYRRRRTVLRTTPMGGVVAYEVEEEVG